MLRGQKQTGFTIVELLIVIVVIAVLATITVVAYNGIQQRATNNSITQTANVWVKALKLYKVDNGGWPNGGFTCLGEGYLYGVSGTDTTGTAQCRQTGASGYTEQTAFKNAMRPYFNNGALPTPVFLTAVDTNGDWRRGIHYAYAGGSTSTDVYINIVYKGTITSCPIIQGYEPNNRYNWSPNDVCSYVLGSITDN